MAGVAASLRTHRAPHSLSSWLPSLFMWLSLVVVHREMLLARDKASSSLRAIRTTLPQLVGAATACTTAVSRTTCLGTPAAGVEERAVDDRAGHAGRVLLLR